MTETLMHHGVKGQRWGVRRRISVSSGAAQTPIKKVSVDKKPLIKVSSGAKKLTKVPTKKKMSKMTTAEMKQQLDRMRTEKEFQKMIKDQSHPKAKAAISAFKTTLSGMKLGVDAINTVASVNRAGQTIKNLKR